MTFIDCPEDMRSVSEELYGVMDRMLAKLQFGTSANTKSCSRAAPPRRGNFPTISVGISHGGGQTVRSCRIY